MYLVLNDETTRLGCYYTDVKGEQQVTANCKSLRFAICEYGRCRLHRTSVAAVGFFLVWFFSLSSLHSLPMLTSLSPYPHLIISLSSLHFSRLSPYPRLIFSLFSPHFLPILTTFSLYFLPIITSCSPYFLLSSPDVLRIFSLSSPTYPHLMFSLFPPYPHLIFSQFLLINSELDFDL